MEIFAHELPATKWISPFSDILWLTEPFSKFYSYRTQPSAYRVDAMYSYRNVDNVILQTYKQEHIWF